MLLLFVRLFGFSDRPEQSSFSNSDKDLEQSSFTGLKPKNLGKEIHKIGRIYHLERRFLL